MERPAERPPTLEAAQKQRPASRPLPSSAYVASSVPFSSSVVPSTSAGSRTHTVRSGETPFSIAKRYGLKLNSLLAANPNLDPKKLRAGQILQIPTK